MRFTKGMEINKLKTFGRLEFLGFDGCRMDNKDKDVIKNKRFGVSSDVQEGALTVFLPAAVDEKKYNFPYETPVELVNPRFEAFATASFSGTETVYNLFADDIIPLNNQTNMNKPKGDKEK